MATTKKVSKRKDQLTAREREIETELAALDKVKDKARRKALRSELNRLAFERVGPRRVKGVLKSLRLLRAVAQGQYTYTTDEAAKIMAAIQNAVNETETAFAGQLTMEKDFEL